MSKTVTAVNPKIITKAVRQLQDLHVNKIGNDTPTGKRVNDAIADVFKQAKRVDQGQTNQPAQNLFYILWKGNQETMHNQVKSGTLTDADINGMQGSSREHRNRVVEEVVKLSKGDSKSELVRDRIGISHLAGILDGITDNISAGSLPNSVLNSVGELGAAIKAHAVSLEHNYARDPMDKGFETVARSLLSVANNDAELLGSSNKFATLVTNKFKAESTFDSGMPVRHSGGDVLANIVKGLLEGNEAVKIPMGNSSSSISPPTLLHMTSLDVTDLMTDLPIGDKFDLGRVSSALHKSIELIDDAKFVDYKGLDVEDPSVIKDLKNKLKESVNALDTHVISSSRGYMLGKDWEPPAPVAVFDNEFSL
jgi:hypothetical protein